MRFIFCIDPTHNTIQPQRDRVHFTRNLFIIGLGAVVLFIVDCLWYLVAHDAPLSAVPSFVGAAVTIACLLSTFQASLRGYRLVSFITMYFAHIRISDLLLVAFVTILFVSGALLALGAAELVVNSSFFALSASVLVLSFDAFSHGWRFNYSAVQYSYLRICHVYFIFRSGVSVKCSDIGSGFINFSIRHVLVLFMGVYIQCYYIGFVVLFAASFLFYGLLLGLFVWVMLAHMVHCYWCHDACLDMLVYCAFASAFSHVKFCSALHCSTLCCCIV